MMDTDFELNANILKKMKDMDFPRSLNIKVWENYLERDLDLEELEYFEDYQSEIKMNRNICELNSIAEKKGLYIPYLTNLYGNCMFESLNHHNLFDDDIKFRENLALLMHIYKDKKNLFPGQESSLFEIFNMSNEIEYILSKNNGKVYKYTYSAMCYDLANNNSWSRLPTELIMMVISYFFNIRFHVISNENEYVHIINTSDEKNTYDIYLGHIGEIHYVPLKLIEQNNKYNVPKHTEAKKNFYKMCIRLWINKNNQNLSDYLD